jgi:Ca2+-transporting ATPase
MTMAFLTIAISQAFHALNMRSDKISIFSKANQKNTLLPLLMMLAVMLVIILAMISMYSNSSSLMAILGMAKMSWVPWITTIGLAVSIIPVVETAKFFKIN